MITETLLFTKFRYGTVVALPQFYLLFFSNSNTLLYYFPVQLIVGRIGDILFLNRRIYCGFLFLAVFTIDADAFFKYQLYAFLAYAVTKMHQFTGLTRCTTGIH